jgi:hypothetical protein
MANYYVVPRADGKWSSRRAGASRASSVHATRAEAQEAATGFALRSGGGEVRIIRGADTRIGEANTIGKADPQRTEG